MSDEPVTDTGVNSLTSKYTRLNLTDTELVLKLHLNGQKQTDIAQIVGCAQSTVSDTISRLQQSPEVTKALLRSDALSAIKDWKRARRQAAKRGDHRPAREWLEAAHPELRPQQTAAPGDGKIVVNIGFLQPAPQALPSVTVETISPVHDAEHTISQTEPLVLSHGVSVSSPAPAKLTEPGL